MSSYYMVCPQPNPASLEQCAWVEVTESVFPPLTAEQGAMVGSAILIVYFAAYCFRQVLQFIEWRNHDD